MERTVLISRLKLSADATDAQIEAALTALEAKAGKTETLEADLKLNLEANVKALVDKAVLDKKFTADLAPHYSKLATADFEGTKTIIDAMQGVTKISAELQEGVAAAGREKWTMEDYQSKDPEALMELMTKDPEKFKQLEAAYFG